VCVILFFFKRENVRSRVRVRVRVRVRSKGTYVRCDISAFASACGHEAVYVGVVSDSVCVPVSDFLNVCVYLRNLCVRTLTLTPTVTLTLLTLTLLF